MPAFTADQLEALTPKDAKSFSPAFLKGLSDAAKEALKD